MLKKASGTPVIISGRLSQAYEKKVPQKITLKKSLLEVIDFINKI